jgi:hypothetical protein
MSFTLRMHTFAELACMDRYIHCKEATSGLLHEARVLAKRFIRLAAYPDI